MISRRSIFAAAALVALSFKAATALPTDLNVLVLDWIRGRYASPIVCEVDGSAARALRELLITAGPRDRVPPVAKIVFVDLEADEASRCVTDLGEPAPNVIGSIMIRLLATSRPDVAQRDFQAALRSKRPFEFDVAAGRLLLREVGSTEPARRVDFAGGSARLTTVARGTDAARLLAEFESPRKVILEITSRDDTKLRFALFQAALH